MKTTLSQLRKVIKESIKALTEDFLPDKDGTIDFANPKIAPKIKVTGMNAQETSTKVACAKTSFDPNVMDDVKEDEPIDLVTLAKLQFAEGKLNEESEIDFTPPQGVRAACKRGLELRPEHGGDGLTQAAVSWARKLASGSPISPEKAKKMNAYFARHVVDKKAGWDSPPTPGYVAWLLWGGDPGKAWSAKLTKQLNAKKNKQ